ncbi:MAG TPA: hypothetical protein VF168_11725 [Trueperaceae bacterium]
MKTISRMTLASIRNNGLKLVLALMLAGGPLVTLGLALTDTATVNLAAGGHSDDVDPG